MSTDMVVAQSAELVFSAEQEDIIYNMCANGAPQEQFRFFLEFCKARGLNPLLKEIYFIGRREGGDEDGGGDKRWTIQTSIDGFRSIAESTGEYDGQDEPDFQYNENGALIRASVRIYRKGISRPFVGVAFYSEFVQLNRYKKPTRMWDKMPHTLLAKCAEAQGFRKAFPRKFGQVYVPEEMMQAESPIVEMPAASGSRPGSNRDNGPESPRAPRREPEMDVEGAVQHAISLLRSASKETWEDAKAQAWGPLVRALGGDQAATVDVWKSRVLAVVRPAQASPSTSSLSSLTPADGVPAVLAPAAPADDAAQASLAAQIVAEAQKLTKRSNEALEQISVGIQQINKMAGLSQTTRDQRLGELAAVRARLLKGGQ